MYKLKNICFISLILVSATSVGSPGAGSQGTGSQRVGSQGTGPQGTGPQGTGTQGTGTQGTGTQGTGTQGTGTQGTGTQGTGTQGGGPPGGGSFSNPMRSRSNLVIPASCVIKAQAIVGSTAMSTSDLAASQAFVNVLSSAGTSVAIDYVLTPNLVQQGSGTSSATTEISIKGFLGSVQLTLLQGSGSSYATAQVFNSSADAQATAASSISTNLIQTSSNQASVNLDVVASNIQRLYSAIGISSDLQSQSALMMSGSGSVTGNPATGLPTTLTHALTLADIISHININAVVTFDGTNLSVISPQANIGC
jgi:hypothetical protein